MAHEVSKLDRTDASNTVVEDGGWPEGMARSLVNNQARQNLGALRRWYQNPEWTQLLEETAGPTYTVTKVTGTQINVASSPATDASEHFPVGARIRVSISGASPNEGHISAVNYSAPDTIVDITFLGLGAVPAGADRAEIYFGHSLQDAAFRETGVGAEAVPLNSDLGTAAYKDEGAASTLDADTVDGEHAQDIVNRAGGGINLLINGDFAIDQRGGHSNADIVGVNSNNDGEMAWDRWRLWSDGNDRFLPQQQATGGGPTGIAFQVGRLNTGSALSAPPSSEQGGVSQVVEAENCRNLQGTDAIFSIYLRKSGTYGGEAGIAILEYTGASYDIVTSVITGWTAPSTLPTWGADWAVVASAYVTAPNTPTWTRFSVTGAVSASAKNVAVVVWIDSNDFAAANVLEMTAAKLTQGSALTPFVSPDPATELTRCQRYFQRTADWPSSGKIQQNGGVRASTLRSINTLLGGAGTDDAALWRLYPPMRIDPTVVTQNPSAANANWSSGNAPTVDARANAVEIKNASGTGDEIGAVADAEI